MRRFMGLVRQQLASPEKRIPTPVYDIAEDLLAQAARFLGDQHVSGHAPGRETSVPQRRVVQQVRERYERLQRQERHRKLTRMVDRIIDKLHRAHSTRQRQAYDDNRALLVEVLNRPDTPAALCDLVKGELRQYPKNAFDRRPARKRGSSRRRAGRAAQASQDEQAPPPKPRSSGHALEVDQQIRDRSEQILAELRTSQAPRPVPRLPPPSR